MPNPKNPAFHATTPGLHPAAGRLPHRVHPHRPGRQPAAAIPARPDRPGRAIPRQRHHHRRRRARRRRLLRHPHPAQPGPDGRPPRRQHRHRRDQPGRRLHHGAPGPEPEHRAHRPRPRRRTGSPQQGHRRQPESARTAPARTNNSPVNRPMIWSIQHTQSRLLGILLAGKVSQDKRKTLLAIVDSARINSLREAACSGSRATTRASIRPETHDPASPPAPSTPAGTSGSWSPGRLQPSRGSTSRNPGAIQ